MFPSLHFRAKRQGFTLVEMFVVMAMATILIALSGFALSSLSMASGVNQSVAAISLSLQQARAYAMAHDTYVWVGFYEDPAANALRVGVVAGTSGLSSDIASTKTYAPIIKLQTYPNSTLSSTVNLSGMAGDPGENSSIDISNSVVSFQQTVAGATVPLSSVVQFSPLGEASLPSQSTASHWIQIGLQPIFGGNRSNPNNAVIQLATLTGQVAVFRR